MSSPSNLCAAALALLATVCAFSSCFAATVSAAAEIYPSTAANTDTSNDPTARTVTTFQPGSLALYLCQASHALIAEIASVPTITSVVSWPIVTFLLRIAFLALHGPASAVGSVSFARAKPTPPTCVWTDHRRSQRETGRSIDRIFHARTGLQGELGQRRPQIVVTQIATSVPGKTPDYRISTQAATKRQVIKNPLSLESGRGRDSCDAVMIRMSSGESIGDLGGPIVSSYFPLIPAQQVAAI